MKKVCNHCYEYTEGGTYIEEKGKKLYFCSGKCLEEYKKRKKEDENKNTI